MARFFNLIYRIVVPKIVRKKIRLKRLKSAIFKYYNNSSSSLPDELKTVLEYIKCNPLSVFPYPFQDIHDEKTIEIFMDKEKGLRYVLLEGKKLYFKRRWSDRRIRHSFNELKREQDSRSPHHYLCESFMIEKDDVLFDIGVAEGNFALMAVERAESLYLFETDKEWVEALNATFEPWKNKVHIINKFVGDRIGKDRTTLDEFFSYDKKFTFLKVDVDGAEAELLKGCEEILSRKSPLKIVICTYHRHYDERDFSALLKEKNFGISHSQGFMLFLMDKKLKAPFFRRGLIRAIR